MLSQLFRDVRHSARSLMHAPAFTLTAVVTLALGIGATTLVFSVVNGVLLRPLPYRDSDRLVNVWHDLVNEHQFLPAVNAADYRDYREIVDSFEAVAAGTGGTISGLSGVLTGDEAPQRVSVSAVSHDFFSLLGVDPTRGRHFTPEEEEFNGPQVVMLRYELWRDRYGADPDLIGKPIQLDGRSFTVVGVLPQGFSLLLPAEAFLIRDADVWVPLQIDYSSLAPRNWTNLTVLARLKPGVSLETAQAEMDVIARQFREDHAAHARAGTQIRLVPYRRDVVKHAGSSIWMLFGAVGFVLLIACANVAHLQLVRGSVRARELAVRASVGAGRAAIIRQMLVESLVLGLMGLALGLVVTLGGLWALEVLQPPNLPRLSEIRLDLAVLAFCAVVSVLTAVLFGLAPAHHAARLDLVSVLREGTQRVSGTSQARLRNALIAAEVAFSIVLLVGLGLMTRSFVALEQVRPGFDSEGVLTFGLALPRTGYEEPEQREAFFTRLEDRLRELPGVSSVGAVSQLPLSGSGPLWPYAPDAETASRGDMTGDGRVVTPGYFESLGIRLVAGRYFRESDGRDGRGVVIIDPMLAARAFPGQDPIGRELLIPFDDETPPVTVVGMVEHTRVYDLKRDVRAHMYRPYPQMASRQMNMVVRTAGDPAGLAPVVREAVWSIDPKLALDDLRPLDAYVSDAMAETRFAVTLLGWFGILALVLAATGVYGVTSFGVSQRTREFGIRIALGESAGMILKRALGRTLGLIAASLTVGLVGAFLLTRSLAGFLYGVSPSDPPTYAVTSVVLMSVALFAAWVPARRATGLDPMRVLRGD